jgi:competence protein ComEC
MSKLLISQSSPPTWWRSPAKIFFCLNLTFIAIIFILGFRPGAFRQTITNRDLAYNNGHYLTLTGRVCEEADLDYKSRRLTVCVSGQTHGQVLVTTDLYPIYDYGDFLKISGQLQAPPKIEGFDYETYLARYDIYSVMYNAKIVKASGDLTWPQLAYRSLLNFKQRLKSYIDLSLPEPEAGLANALLLGYRRTVGREDLDIFARVGLSHMIAISGSHITILSAMIINFFLALGLSRRRAILIIFGFLFLYPLITGLAASAVRSAIMGALAFLAIYNERRSSLIKALVFAAAAMLAFNPCLLRDDVGFQLTFLALLGIIYIYPLLDRLSANFLNKLSLKSKTKNIVKIILDTINLTLVSQIVILPVALITFKQLSLIAPLANVLVLWTFPPLIASVIIGLFTTALIPMAGVLWFSPAYFLLKYIFVVSNLLSSPSWAAVNIAWFNWWWGAGYYLILAVVIKMVNKKTVSSRKRSFTSQ